MDVFMRPMDKLLSLIDTPDNDLTEQEIRLLAFHQGWKNISERPFTDHQQFTHPNAQYEQAVRFWSMGDTSMGKKLLRHTGDMVFQKIGTNEIFDFIGNFKEDTTKHPRHSIQNIMAKSLEIYKNILK